MFADYQNEIYQRGAKGERPNWPISIEALEKAAKERLTPEAYNYIAGGAGGEKTMANNLSAFDRWEIVPRMLRDVSSRECGIRLFGQDLPVPILLAPIGVQSIAHADGEKAVGRAAAQLGVPYIHSTAATASPEEVAEQMGSAPRWFQLYWPKDPELAASFVARSEAAGYSALVVTLDTRQLAWRERDLTAAYLPFLRGEGMGIYLSDPVFRERLGKDPREDMKAAISLWAENFSDLSHTWGEFGDAKELHGNAAHPQRYSSS